LPAPVPRLAQWTTEFPRAVTMATVSVEEFGASFKGFLDQMASQAPAEEPIFLRQLRMHFGSDPATLPIVSEQFEKYDQPNVHTAIETYVSGEGRSSQIMGILAGHAAFRGISLSDLVAPQGFGLMGGQAPREGPVQYINVRLEGDRVLSCVQSGLYLVRDGQEPLALLVHADMDFHPFAKLKIEAMGLDKGAAERFLANLRITLRKNNVYRGHVLSLGQTQFHSLEIKFHHLPKIARENIILPEGLLSRVERQTI